MILSLQAFNRKLLNSTRCWGCAVLYTVYSCKMLLVSKERKVIYSSVLDTELRICRIHYVHGSWECGLVNFYWKFSRRETGTSFIKGHKPIKSKQMSFYILRKRAKLLGSFTLIALSFHLFFEIISFIYWLSSPTHPIHHIFIPYNFICYKYIFCYIWGLGWTPIPTLTSCASLGKLFHFSVSHCNIWAYYVGWLLWELN